jgi:hypothetical protein
MYLDEISRKQWFKNKVKHKQRAHYISVDLGINRYHFCTEKEQFILKKNIDSNSSLQK